MNTTEHATLHLPGPAAAAELGVSLRTLQRLAERGDVQRNTFGRRTLYAVEARHQRDDTRHAPVEGTRHAPPAPRRTATEARHPRQAPDATAAALVELATRAASAELEAARLRSELEATRAELDTMRAELVTTRRAWARAHAGWQVARAVVDQVTTVR